MPTGYTNKIGDGQSFNDFVMGCARAFSPLITIRDDPSDAPIPDEFAPTQFYVNQIAKYQEDLARLRAMNSGEVAKEFDNFIAGISAENKRRRDECVVLRSRYKAMRALACSWQPPTSHHIGLRDFMIKQIDDSIVHDCRDYQTPINQLMTPMEWHSHQITELKRGIERCKKSQEEEVLRCQERTQWVRQLRASLEVNDGSH
jgi:hypothetical protein